ncbi:pyridoxal-phosphate dependent enzyme [Comamonas flocculans]|uniref:Pyridoxal-phosphate dependent enzyme n=1 Tax=Comamonas flocculans TaxID=2597701 RepID=A0A5B8RSJ3_9BURK|nr:pyridoxal-phosphate dependent enzyme [Comamonas flocculans]
MPTPAMPLPTPSDVLAAARVLEGVAHRTPVLRSTTIDRLFGAALYFKCENLQRTGSFKFRGAYCALAQLERQQRGKGVLAYSSGNHAQAVALAASLHDTEALIVMPEDASAAKLAATRGYGAQVVTYRREQEDREALSQRLAHERQLGIVPPSDHPAIIAGHGTAVLELLQQVPRLDYLFVPVGGGGLLAGSLLAVRAAASNCEVFGVQPEAAGHASRSLASGQIITVTHPRTIADAAQTPALAPTAFEVIRQATPQILSASDPQMLDALRFLAQRMKLVAEPTGALAFAGAQSGAVDLHGKRVGIVISGGNVDLSRYARFISD